MTSICYLISLEQKAGGKCSCHGRKHSLIALLPFFAWREKSRVFHPGPWSALGEMSYPTRKVIASADSNIAKARLDSVKNHLLDPHVLLR